MRDKYIPNPAEQFWYEKLGTGKLALALSRLDRDTQIILYFRFWEAHSIEEIARLLNSRWDTVDRELNNALEELRLGLGGSFNNYKMALTSAS